MCKHSSGDVLLMSTKGDKNHNHGRDDRERGAAPAGDASSGRGLSCAPPLAAGRVLWGMRGDMLHHWGTSRQPHYKPCKIFFIAYTCTLSTSFPWACSVEWWKGERHLIRALSKQAFLQMPVVFKTLCLQEAKFRTYGRTFSGIQREFRALEQSFLYVQELMALF